MIFCCDNIAKNSTFNPARTRTRPRIVVTDLFLRKGGGIARENALGSKFEKDNIIYW